MTSISRGLIIGLLSGLFTTTSLACDNHGFPGFGFFPQHHSPYNQSNRSKVKSKQIILKHSRYTLATLDKQELINISYIIPKDFSLATLEVSSSSNIEFEQAGKIALNDIKGTYKLAYKAKSSGAHVIKIKAEALNDGNPYSKSQKIYLTAK